MASGNASLRDAVRIAGVQTRPAPFVGIRRDSPGVVPGLADLLNTLDVPGPVLGKLRNSEFRPLMAGVMMEGKSFVWGLS